MKHFNPFRTLTPSGQFRLLLLFTAVLIIPNLLLLFTEPYTWSTRLTNILLPTGCYLYLLTRCRKPGIPLWLLLPLLVIGAFQIVLLYLFGNSVIAVDMFYNLLTTNSGEAGELLVSIWPSVLIVCLIYLPTLTVATYSLLAKATIEEQLRSRTTYFALTLTALGVGNSFYSSFTNPDYRPHHAIFPLNVFHNLTLTNKRYQADQTYPQTSAAFHFQAERTDSLAQRQIYLLVVGETGRAANWSLFGYDRPTNPLLSQREGVIPLPDALTQSNATHKSVPIILAGLPAERYAEINQRKSGITAFREAGFRTIFITNHLPNHSYIDYFAHEADTLIDLNLRADAIAEHHAFDGMVLPLIDSLISQTSEEIFIVFHSYGSHFNYAERYPKSFAHFTPDLTSTITRSERESFTNAYDNSVRYTDQLLDSLITLLNRDSLVAGLFYLSDHGEDLMDDSRGKFLHASPIPTYYQLHIPALAWFSPAYRQARPSKYATAIENRLKPVDTSVALHTLLDAAAIASPHLLTERALTSTQYAIRNRRYVNDYNEAPYFFNLGLHPFDLKLLKERKIEFDSTLYQPLRY